MSSDFERGDWGVDLPSFVSGDHMSLLHELGESLVVKVVASLLAPIVIALIYYALRRVFRAFRALRLAESALSAVARRQENGIWVEGPGFWLKKPIVPPWKDYETRMQASIPILMIATAKGGVGKTTLSGSLAAHFATRWRQTREEPQSPKPVRVLLIDSDFQGSMTTMTVPDDSRHLLPSKANKLISGEIGDGLQRTSTPRASRPNMQPISVWTVPAYYDLAQAENRVMVQWLLPLSDFRSAQLAASFSQAQATGGSPISQGRALSAGRSPARLACAA